MEATEKPAATLLWNAENFTMVTFERRVTFGRLNQQSRGKSLSGGLEAVDVTAREEIPVCREGMSSLQGRDVQFLAQPPPWGPQSSRSRVQALQDTQGSLRAPEGWLRVCDWGKTRREQENLPGCCLMECE